MSSDAVTGSDAVAEPTLSAEDAKLVTLARGAKARVSSRHGAAVRDETGRTYAAADALMPSLPLTALQVAVAQAWVAGARGLEAAVVVADNPDEPVDLAVVGDLGGPGVRVLVCAPDGSVARTLLSELTA